MPRHQNQYKKPLAVGITLLISGLLTIWGIYGLRDYGVALFFLIPLLIGACPALLYGINRGITQGEGMKLGLLTLGLFAVGLLVCAIEGVICMVMAAPIAILLTCIGSYIGCLIINKLPNEAPTAMMVIIAVTPLTAYVEKGAEPSLTSVTTSIEIAADPATVWKNVIAFPRLDEPTEFIFKTGISYPTDATISGNGVGAVRHCNFTTGSFVEPVTVWDEDRQLSFDVVEQPSPMKELSFWDVNAPHLHDYFVSRKGQFLLTRLPNGNTRLEGTTWYYHRIKPEFYWRWWSDFIIHSIHQRVLEHIKRTAESQNSIVNDSR